MDWLYLCMTSTFGHRHALLPVPFVVVVVAGLIDFADLPLFGR